MSKLECLIEALSIQKQLFFASLISTIGVTIWGIANAGLPWWVLAGATTVVVCSAAFGYTRYRIMGKLLDEIEAA